MAEERLWLCDTCDWTGSDDRQPEVCPICRVDRPREIGLNRDPGDAEAESAHVG